MNRTSGMCAGQIIGTMNGQQVVAMDIAKLVFQVYTVQMSTGEIVNMQLKRAKVTQYFANRPACLIAMEACGGAHHWARELAALGHTVKLLDAKSVRPFVTGNKTDATDARAIWLAVQQPGAKFVGMKTVHQQATLTLHRQRELLMKMRNMQTNALRGLLYEFGVTFAQGNKALFSGLEAALQTLSGQLPQMVCDSLREQLARIKALDQDIDTLAKRLAVQLRQDPQMKRIAQIPGVGVLTATAAIATMGGRSRLIPLGAPVLCLAGVGADADRYRWQGPPGRHLQARRYVPAHPAHTRRQERAEPQQGAWALVAGVERPQAPQRGDRGAGGQNGAHDLGACRRAAGLPKGPPKRQASSMSAA